jgi:hypothetical protein
VKLTQRSLVVLAVTTACALVLAATAQALIQVQRGISGVALNMTPAQVKTGLGTPSKINTGTNTFGKFTQYVYPGGITVAFQGNANVTAVVITGQTDRTATGVGVGSTENAVKTGVPGVKCETIAGARDCHVGAFLPGKKITDFLMKNGHVKRVTVGFVID